MQPSSQFLTHQAVHPSHPCLSKRDKNIMCDGIKYFAQVRVHHICWSFLIHQQCNPAPEGYQMRQALSHGTVKPQWLSPTTSLFSMCPSTASRRNLYCTWRNPVLHLIPRRTSSLHKSDNMNSSLTAFSFHLLLFFSSFLGEEKQE